MVKYFMSISIVYLLYLYSHSDIKVWDTKIDHTNICSIFPCLILRYTIYIHTHIMCACVLDPRGPNMSSCVHILDFGHFTQSN